jgi:hypothetical protein
MRRMLLMAVMGSALALAAPGVASAHHGKRHHARHHKQAHLVKFGSASVSTTPSGPTATTPTTTPTGTPAGKVKSFDKETGLLTITLADESTVSGKVTEATKLECRSATSQENSGDDDQRGGDDGATVGDEHGGPSAHESDHHGSDGGGDVGDDNAGQTACTTAALVPGAVVGEAELLVGGSGAVWEKVELIQ